LGRSRRATFAKGSKVHVASLLDAAGTKAQTVQQRAQARDYVDIDALIRHGIDLPQVLAAGAAVYGGSFNPLLTLKALSYLTMCRQCRVTCRNGCGQALSSSIQPACRC